MSNEHLATLIASALAASIATALLSRVLVRWLRQRQLLDRPNDRSSHVEPTPRGGGLAVVCTVLGICGGLSLAFDPPREVLTLAGAFALLVFVSWLDDRGGLSAPIRFGAQVIAVTAILIAIPTDQTLFGHEELVWPERVALGAGLMWWINVYNFMDGIDGLCSTQTLFIGAGIVLIGVFADLNLWLVGTAAVLAGAAAGFLTVNWKPARVFLGDVGSVPLGLATGYLLIKLTFTGAWAASILIGAYFAADATLTILMRALNGERIWEPHRNHFYQRAAAVDRDHAAVVKVIIVALTGLTGLAAVSLRTPWVALLMGAGLVAALLIVLSQRARREQGPST